MMSIYKGIISPDTTESEFQSEVSAFYPSQRI